MLKLLKALFRISTIFKILTSICLVALVLSYLAPFVHPTTFWLLPFFGLAYPIIIICTLVFLVIWAIAKSKWFFVVLLFIIIGGKLHFRLYSLPFGLEKETSLKTRSPCIFFKSTVLPLSSSSASMFISSSVLSKPAKASVN